MEASMEAQISSKEIWDPKDAKWCNFDEKTLGLSPNLTTTVVQQTICCDDEWIQWNDS